MSEYEERDIESQGEFYQRHVSAMTGENLHGKSAIAAELAYRDIIIQQLEQQNKEMLEMLKEEWEYQDSNYDEPNTKLRDLITKIESQKEGG